MKTELIDYTHAGEALEGFLAHEKPVSEVGKGKKRPCVIVAHAWAGKSEFSCQKAKDLAGLGYVGFALDMYGKGKLGESNEECAAHMTPFKEDRQFLRDRIMAAYDTVRAHPHVDPDRIGIIGFCFGGLCALDLARSGVPLKSVVSFHGLLDAPVGVKMEPIQAKILALHGHDDPMVPPADVLTFEQEMTEGRVDWQMHVYGNTMHAFTNPKASDKAFGTVYSEVADKRAWLAMKSFFAETL